MGCALGDSSLLPENLQDPSAAQGLLLSAGWLWTAFAQNLARQLDHELGIKIFREDSDSSLENWRGHTQCNVVSAQSPRGHRDMKET